MATEELKSLSESLSTFLNGISIAATTANDKINGTIGAELPLNAELAQTILNAIKVLNGEYKIVNEELKIVSEELKGVKEEMKSVKEELKAIRQELTAKPGDLKTDVEKLKEMVVSTAKESRVELKRL